MNLDAKWEDFKTPEQWREWLDVAAKEAPDLADWWTTAEGCEGCRYFSRHYVWCMLHRAPATRNPVLNTLGMACCGFDYMPADEQKLGRLM